MKKPKRKKQGPERETQADWEQLMTGTAKRWGTGDERIEGTGETKQLESSETSGDREPGGLSLQG